MYELPWLMHSRVSCTFASYMKPEPAAEVLRVSRVETVALTQDHVDIVGHLCNHSAIEHYSCSESNICLKSAAKTYKKENSITGDQHLARDDCYGETQQG